METRKLVNQILLWTLIVFFCFACFLWFVWRWMSPEERAIRQTVVETAEQYLGCKEADGSHQQIIDLYNSQESLPRGYEVTYEDSWCATFGSAVAIEAEMADWIPLECSCQEQIALFDRVGDWEESDWYLPQPGDYIFYDWEGKLFGDNTGWSDHVGIVVATYGPVIKVIEGNLEDGVGYHYVFVNHPQIRGYGLPDYRKMSATS